MTLLCVFVRAGPRCQLCGSVGALFACLFIPLVVVMKAVSSHVSLFWKPAVRPLMLLLFLKGAAAPWTL